MHMQSEHPSVEVEESWWKTIIIVLFLVWFKPPLINQGFVCAIPAQSQPILLNPLPPVRWIWRRRCRSWWDR